MAAPLSGAFWALLPLRMSLGKGIYKMHEMFYCLSDLTMHLPHSSTHFLPIVHGSSLPPFIVTV